MGTTLLVRIRTWRMAGPHIRRELVRNEVGTVVVTLSVSLRAWGSLEPTWDKELSLFESYSRWGKNRLTRPGFFLFLKWNRRRFNMKPEFFYAFPLIKPTVASPFEKAPSNIFSLGQPIQSRRTSLNTERKSVCIFRLPPSRSPRFGFAPCTPPFRPPPIANMGPAVPWSVPAEPFSKTLRPNSE